MTDREVAEKIKEKVIEWLDVTGAIPKGCGWYYELLSFFDEEVESALKTARQEEREACAKEADRQDHIYAEGALDPYGLKRVIVQALRNLKEGKDV